MAKFWEGFVLEDYDYVKFAPGALALDVGCGLGMQLQELQRRGCQGLGVELQWDCAVNCRDLGLNVLQGSAEQLPLRNATVDGIVCKGVITYTKEAYALREISRVLKPGGISYFCNLGAGFYLRCLLCGRSWRVRFYGLRALINTWLEVATGRRLPGFLGDTIYQSRRRLENYYREIDLRLLQDTPAPTFLWFPVFIYHCLQKVAE